jgi:hypothetical protein
MHHKGCDVYHDLKNVSRSSWIDADIVASMWQEAKSTENSHIKNQQSTTAQQ